MDQVKLIRSCLGVPYVSGGKDLTGFDCWGLLQYFYSYSHGLDLPDFPEVSRDNVRELTRTIGAGAEAWQRVEKPQHLDAVTMSQNSAPHHVGIYIEDGGQQYILHAHKTSSCLQTMRNIQVLGWRNLKFYRPTS